MLRKITVEQAEEENLVTDSRLGKDPVPFGFIHDRWLHFKAQIKAGDELCAFRTDKDSWENLAGREGVCIMRDGKVIAELVTEMN